MHSAILEVFIQVETSGCYLWMWRLEAVIGVTHAQCDTDEIRVYVCRKRV